MKSLIPILLLALSISWACNSKPAEEDRRDEADVVLRTEKGDIYLKLYDETPGHKENFLKLAKEGFFDGMGFHRVIVNFMIQSGDPRSKEGGDPFSKEDDAGYNLDAEIVPNLLHTRGKLAAARYPDEINPKWESSSSQFYIVTGKSISDEDLDYAEESIEAARQSRLYNEYTEKYKNGEFQEEFMDYLGSIGHVTFAYTQEQRDLYKEKGGYPGLDMQYTVFGEVVYGIGVAFEIGRVPTSQERPLTPIRITKAEIVSES